ncbi:hypothetical protein, partial [Flavobacterium sp. T12S277]|uniref:hypothetical protein n=1 Tax=Flavobacterium sp. T12S277 TaxID=3402752 RepID=UPI003ADC2B39
HDELVEQWRILYKKQYLDCFSKIDFESLSTKLNKELKKLNIKINTNPSYAMVIKSSTLRHMNFGNCQNCNNMSVFAMRSMGIADGDLKDFKEWKKDLKKFAINFFQFTPGALLLFVVKKKFRCSLITQTFSLE